MASAAANNMPESLKNLLRNLESLPKFEAWSLKNRKPRNYSEPGHTCKASRNSPTQFCASPPTNLLKPVAGLAKIPTYVLRYSESDSMEKQLPTIRALRHLLLSQNLTPRNPATYRIVRIGAAELPNLVHYGVAPDAIQTLARPADLDTIEGPIRGAPDIRAILIFVEPKNIRGTLAKLAESELFQYVTQATGGGRRKTRRRRR